MSTKEVKINENIAVNEPEFNKKYTTKSSASTDVISF
jgi:hypothetical protein